MKRHLALATILLLATVQPGFAQNRDIIQLQQTVALLLGTVRELQRSFDERMAVMRTLVEQSSDRTNQFQERMTQLNSAMTELQTSLQNSVANSSQKVDNMGTQIQGLHGSLDELRARLDMLSQQIAKIETLSQTISSSTFPVTGIGTDPASDPVNMANAPAPDVLYNTALRDYTSGNYPLSLQEFTDYLRYYPNTSLASNAQFYVGDIYYQQGQFEKALQEYDKAIEQYPTGTKSAASQLKKGFALINMNLRPQGIQELNSLVRRFPNTPEASLAQDKLTALESEPPPPEPASEPAPAPRRSTR
jgi:tol-pal system protein YbgF